MNLQNAICIGRMAVFYIPSCKLDTTLPEGTPRQMLHDFFMQHYNAYTHEASKIHGYWCKQDMLVFDEHERYEVSFDGEDKVHEFVAFLSRFCQLIGEDCIYLTMGEKSWLVMPSV